MSGIKNLFKKKKKPEKEQPTLTPSYESVNAASLTSMSAPELLNIIYRYNSEVKILNSNASNLTAELSSSKSLASQLSDETSSHKEQNEKLNKELHESSNSLRETTESLESVRKELEIAQSQLQSKDCLLYTSPSPRDS